MSVKHVYPLKMSLEIYLLVSFETKVMWPLSNRTLYRKYTNCFV